MEFLEGFRKILWITINSWKYNYFVYNDVCLYWSRFCRMLWLWLVWVSSIGTKDKMIIVEFLCEHNWLQTIGDCFVGYVLSYMSFLFSSTLNVIWVDQFDNRFVNALAYPPCQSGFHIVDKLFRWVIRHF